MPFTLSHPAAVLPLLRHPFSAVALVAGAIAPDLPYFARSTPIPVSAQSWYEPFLNATTSHGLAGALTVSLPYGLALCGLYRVARRPVERLLGADGRAARATSEVRGAAVRRAGWVLLSLLIGIATHLVWDSFTHSDGYVVMHVPALSEPLTGDLTWARALQHVSTAVGLVLIAAYLWRRRPWSLPVPPEGADGRPRLGPVLWSAGLLVVAGAVVGTLDLWGGTGLTAAQTVEALLAGSAKGAGAALLGGLILYVVAWWVVHGVRTLRR